MPDPRAGRASIFCSMNCSIAGGWDAANSKFTHMSFETREEFMMSGNCISVVACSPQRRWVGPWPPCRPRPWPRTPPTKTVGLEEIIVTAQKREQSVQDVPIAVTAVTEASLQSNRIFTVADLSSVAPGMTVKPSAGGINTPTITIRGQEQLRRRRRFGQAGLDLSGWRLPQQPARLDLRSARYCAPRSAAWPAGHAVRP